MVNIRAYKNTKRESKLEKGRLIKQYREYVLFYPIFRKAVLLFIRELQTVAFGNWYVTV